MVKVLNTDNYNRVTLLQQSTLLLTDDISYMEFPTASN